MDNKSIKILLIEDDPECAYLIREMLATAWNAPLELEHTAWLSTGQKRLATETFDLVLLDLSLPDNRGFDTFAKIHDQAPSVPIIVLSGLNDKKLATRIVQAGAQDYLVKGQIDANLLARAIRYAIEHEPLERAQWKSEERLEPALL